MPSKALPIAMIHLYLIQLYLILLYSIHSSCVLCWESNLGKRLKLTVRRMTRYILTRCMLGTSLCGSFKPDRLTTVPVVLDYLFSCMLTLDSSGPCYSVLVGTAKSHAIFLPEILHDTEHFCVSIEVARLRPLLPIRIRTYVEDAMEPDSDVFSLSADNQLQELTVEPLSCLQDDQNHDGISLRLVDTSGTASAISTNHQLHTFTNRRTINQSKWIFLKNRSCTIPKKISTSIPITLPQTPFPTVTILTTLISTFYPHKVCYFYYLTKRHYLTVCYIIATEQTEPGPSVRPFLDAVSKQLEAIIPETTSKSEEIFSDSDDPSYIPSVPPTPQRQRKRMACARSTSQTLKFGTSRDEVSAKRTGKRQRREDTLKEENHQVRKRREKTIDNFFYFLYFLAFCSLLFFLIFLFLLSVLFLFSLYAFYLSYQ